MRRRVRKDTHAHAAVRTKLSRQICLRKCTIFAPFLGLFSGRLLVVMVLAHGLVIVRVDEQRPVSTVRLLVINHRGTGTVPGITGRVLPCTLTAPGISGQLCWAQLLYPERLQVPAVILRADSSLVLGSMLGAPPVSGKVRAALMSAGPERFTCQGYHLLAKRKKSRHQSPNPSGVGHWHRLSKHWPLSIFTISSVLQHRQKATTSSPLVVGRIFGVIFFRQVGQTGWPSFTVIILPCIIGCCNAFTPLYNKIIYSSSRKII